MTEYQRKNAAVERRIEAHFAGTDHDIAGLLRRKSAAPIKPKKEQKPCDIGLFSDEADQADLIEMLMEPINDE